MSALFEERCEEPHVTEADSKSSKSTIQMGSFFKFLVQRVPAK